MTSAEGMRLWSTGADRNVYSYALEKAVWGLMQALGATAGAMFCVRSSRKLGLRIGYRPVRRGSS